MPFWYNEPKDGKKFSNLYRSDWKEINTTIHFSELGILESDDFYHLFMNATSVNDVVSVGSGKDWKFPSGLTSLKIARKNYTKEDYKNKKQVDVEQHRVEKLFCHLITKYDLTKIYSGSIFFQDGSIVDMILTGVGTNNKPMPEEAIEMMSEPYLNLEVVKNSESIKLDELELPATKNNWSKGSYGQSELIKLNDRLSFIISQLKLQLPDEKIENVGDIYQACNHLDSDKATIAIAIWEYCKDLIK